MIRRNMIRRIITMLAAALVVGLATPPASAQVIVRDGADYDGYANPNGCNIRHEGSTELHVNCRWVEGDGGARIRYRFLKDVGGKFAPADVRVITDDHGACR